MKPTTQTVGGTNAVSHQSDPIPSMTSGIPGLNLSDGNIPAASTYFLGALTGVAFLLWGKYNRNPLIRFHAFQSIFANGSILLVRSFLDVLGGEIGSIVRPITTLAWLGIWGFLMFKAYRGEKFPIPVIGTLAERQAASVERHTTEANKPN